MTKDLTSYEQQRLKNIELNNALLAELDIKSAKSFLKTVPENSHAQEGENGTKRKRKAYTARPKKAPVEPLPTRKSSRIRGEEALAIEIDKESNFEVLLEKVENDERIKAIIAETKRLTAEEYFDPEVKSQAIISDGHFKGWVNPDIIQKYGMEGSSAEAWEKNGGGTFSFADPTGSGGKKRKKTGSSKGSSAKDEAQKMFKKNPNQYFYRLNEPGEKQWEDDWSEEEKNLFLKVAKELGCGDKWGLFASYIPHRVGYQCSSFYRHTIIKNGLVFDPNFNFTPSGEPYYVGRHGSRRS